MSDKKRKILTFSFDDGVTQDIKLVKLFNRDGIRGTFNINSECLGKKAELIIDNKHIAHNKLKEEDIKYVYREHEIAAHTLTHPNLT